MPTIQRLMIGVALAFSSLALTLVLCTPARSDPPSSSRTMPASSGAARTSRPSVSNPRAATKRHVVAAVGDSLTDQRSHGGKFLDYLQKKCPHSRFDNYGKGGEMVNQMRRRFARDVLGEGLAPGSKPTYTDVIIFGGVNDVYSDLTARRRPRSIERDLAKMYRLAHDHGIRVIAVTISPWGGFRRYYNARRGCYTLQVNAWIRSRVNTGEVDAVVDSYPLLSCGNPERLCDAYVKPFNDGLHFNAAAHAKLGEALYQAAFRDCE